MHHLAIYNSKIHNRDFIDLILSGAKKADLKILDKRIAPYEKVQTGDYIFLKESSGPVRGCVKVAKVVNYQFENPNELLELLNTIWRDIGMNDQSRVKTWWERVAGKKYATLIYFENPYRLKTLVKIFKTDRRSWVSGYALSAEEIEAFAELNLQAF
jgi:hypothetical protein